MLKRIESTALLVRSIGYGEADIIVTFLTREAGKLACIVRGGRRSQKRFGGALEPIHELFVTIEDKGRELCLLKEARVARARHGITASLEAMEAAGQALRWTRHLCPPRVVEREAAATLDGLLDRLDERALRGEAIVPNASTAPFGLRLLADVGYALELERCVRCGRPCPAGRPAFVDPEAGGIVCSACGGARRTIKSELRDRALRAQRGEGIDFSAAEGAEIVAIVEEVMAAHSGFDAS